jgi:hypothetical protein
MENLEVHSPLEYEMTCVGDNEIQTLIYMGIIIENNKHIHTNGTLNIILKYLYNPPSLPNEKRVDDFKILKLIFFF